MALKSWFPTIIYDETLEPERNVSKRMLQYAVDFHLNNEDKLEDAANVTGDVTGDYQIAHKPEFKWLNKEVFNHCKKYLEVFGVDYNNLNLFSSKSWIVACDDTRKIDHASKAVERHNHLNSHLSVIFYLQVDESFGGELEITAPLTHPLWYVPLAPYVDKLPYPSLTTINYTPEVNKIIIFPSSLFHCVQPYFGKFPRYSVVYDILITGKEGITSDNEMCIVNPLNWVDLDE